MALAQTHKSKGPETKCPNKTRIGIIFTDNQAAIQACASPRSSSGQYILHQIFQLAVQVQGCGWNIQLQWTPGHGVVYCNEHADALAKDTTGSPAHVGRGASPHGQHPVCSLSRRCCWLFDKALTVCTSCTDCLFWDVFFPLLGLSESAYKATLPSSSSSSSSLHAWFSRYMAT